MTRSVVMRRHNSYDILYDEHFLTRGYDEMELIEQLRSDGGRGAAG